MLKPNCSFGVVIVCATALAAANRSAATSVEQRLTRMCIVSLLP